MTNKEYCDTLKVGELVLFGQVLNSMEKKGCIESYDKTYKYCDGRNDLIKNFEFLDNQFSLSYLDGCFHPYVKKIGPKKEGEQEVKHTMCLWGAII